MRNGFTLVEMMISIMLLALILLGLNKVMSTFKYSNTLLSKKSSVLVFDQKILKTIYSDLWMKIDSKKNFSTNDENNLDFISFATKHSIYQRTNPYVAYFHKNNRLYRIESNEPLTLTGNKEPKPFYWKNISNIDDFGDIYYFKYRVGNDFSLIDFRREVGDIPILLKISH